MNTYRQGHGDLKSCVFCCYLFFAVVWMWPNTMLAQSVEHEPSLEYIMPMDAWLGEVLQRNSRALDTIHSLTYFARDYLKSFGTEQYMSFRTFHVHARRNNDSYYGWDFEITEVRDETNTVMSHIHLPPDHYTRFNLITEESGPKQSFHHLYSSGALPLQSHVNYIRHIIFPDPLIHGVVGTHYANHTLDTAYQNQNEHVFMSFIMPSGIGNIKNYQNIKIDSKLSLPVWFEAVQQDTVLDLNYVLRVELSDIRINHPLPDSALNPGYFFDQGYILIVPEAIDENRRVADSVQLASRRELTLESLTELPLTHARGDTFNIALQEHGYTLIDFWFMNCLPCIIGFTKIDSLLQAGQWQNVKIYAVNGYDMNPDVIVTMQNRIPAITFGHTVRERLREWGITSYPTYLLYDHHGHLLYRGSRLNEVKGLIRDAALLEDDGR